MNSVTRTGRSSPLGATIVGGGANFSLFSRSATGVELLFFDSEDDARPERIISIDPAAGRTYHYWHTFVPGVEQDKSTAIVSTHPLIRHVDCGLTPQKYRSIHTVVA